MTRKLFKSINEWHAHASKVSFHSSYTLYLNSYLSISSSLCYWWCSRHFMHVFRIAPHQIEFWGRHSKLEGLVLCIVWSMLFPCSFLFMGAVFDITFRFSQMFEFQQYFMVLIIYLYRCARDGVFLRNSGDELRTQKKHFFF